jgi:hypothetical protein
MERHVCQFQTVSTEGFTPGTRGQLVSKMGPFVAFLLGWSGVSAVDSARLSDCPTSSIPTAPTNISFVNCELQICEGA